MYINSNHDKNVTVALALTLLRQPSTEISDEQHRYQPTLARFFPQQLDAFNWPQWLNVTFEKDKGKTPEPTISLGFRLDL